MILCSYTVLFERLLGKSKAFVCPGAIPPQPRAGRAAGACAELRVVLSWVSLGRRDRASGWTLASAPPCEAYFTPPDSAKAFSLIFLAGGVFLLVDDLALLRQ